MTYSPVAQVHCIASSHEGFIIDPVVRPKIYSGVKLNKFYNFTPQNEDLDETTY